MPDALPAGGAGGFGVGVRAVEASAGWRSAAVAAAAVGRGFGGVALAAVAAATSGGADAAALDARRWLRRSAPRCSLLTASAAVDVVWVSRRRGRAGLLRVVAARGGQEGQRHDGGVADLI